MKRRTFVRSTLTASVAASAPGFRPPSALPRAPATEPPWFDVRAYGADPTNTVDSTDAFHRAITDASALGTWAVVYVPGGEYLITTIRMKSRVILQGQGYQSTLNQRAGTTGDMIVLDTPEVDKAQIRGLRLVGWKANQTTANRGIVLDHPGSVQDDFDAGDSTLTVDDVWVKETKGTGVWVGNEVRDLRMSRVRVDLCGSAAEHAGFEIRGTDSAFVSCTSGNNNGTGFLVSAYNCHFVACKAFGTEDLSDSSQGDGWFITGRGNKLLACEAQDNDRHGFAFYRTQRCTASGLIADSNGRGTAVPNGAGFVLDACSYIHLEGVAYNRDGLARQDYGLSIRGTSFCTVILKSVDNNTGDIEQTTWHANNVVILDGQVRIPVLATANLPAAGSAWDGLFVIEDAGRGNRNLVFYAGGRRFRVDGAAAL
jgi:Pectate lyase superfamily protein